VEGLKAPSREKVEEIKRAIAEGSYQIDVHRISEAILRDILGE
jgi:negative regulator of flagellin synthesis FlgM